MGIACHTKGKLGSFKINIVFSLEFLILSMSGLWITLAAGVQKSGYCVFLAKKNSCSYPKAVRHS